MEKKNNFKPVSSMEQEEKATAKKEGQTLANNGVKLSQDKSGDLSQPLSGGGSGSPGVKPEVIGELSPRSTPAVPSTKSPTKGRGR